MCGPKLPAYSSCPNPDSWPALANNHGDAPGTPGSTARALATVLHSAPLRSLQNLRHYVRDFTYFTTLRRWIPDGCAAPCVLNTGKVCHLVVAELDQGLEGTLQGLHLSGQASNIKLCSDPPEPRFLTPSELQLTSSLRHSLSRRRSVLGAQREPPTSASLSRVSARALNLSL